MHQASGERRLGDVRGIMIYSYFTRSPSRDGGEKKPETERVRTFSVVRFNPFCHFAVPLYAPRNVSTLFS